MFGAVHMLGAKSMALLMQCRSGPYMVTATETLLILNLGTHGDDAKLREKLK
jgi:hypothetical protein